MDEKKIGLFQNNKGELSSGRVVKLIAGASAFVLAFIGLYVVSNDASNELVADYCFKMAGLFLGVATSAELVQKITGR